ncbi:O-antigen ligase family protein [Nocardioides currus]|uniref:O-antigen ligase-related domain-containing protein n=1 Tax=Nocardioides currus TaxID=2133958 RepID=A0A2R7YZM2_9ACTN|nr:O-antigen ligase family protein [Nocardioides currus]PUA81476.1 hypothetical protein C7S10_05165 [Nocardioides currus]
MSGAIVIGLLGAGVVLLAVLTVSMHARLGTSLLLPVGVVAVLQPLNGIRPFHSTAVGDLALVALAAVCLPLLPRLRMPPQVLVVFTGVLLLTAGGFLGTMADGSWDETGAMLRFLIGAPVVMGLLSVLDPSPRAASYLALMYAAGAAISSLGAMAGRTSSYFQRAMGFSEHQMHLALAAMFGSVVAVGWFVSTRDRRARLAAAVLFVVCGYGGLLTGSRSALLGTMAALGYLALLGRWPAIRAAFALGVAGAVALVVAMPFMPQGSTVFRLLGRGELSGHVDLSNADHVQKARDAIEEIGRHPWTGLGFDQGLDAHNLLLESANVGGVLGVLGFLTIWGTIGTLLVRQLVLGVRREDALRASVLAALAGYFVLGMLENIIWDRHLWFFITLALFALPPTRADARDPGRDDAPTNRFVGASPGASGGAQARRVSA